MNQEDLLKELRDIKPLLEVPDSSIYLFYGAIALGVSLLALIFWKAYKSFFKKRKKDAKARALETLQRIDFSDSKSAAYTITKLGALFLDEPNAKEAYIRLIGMLETYKYKKDVPSMDEDTTKQFYHFLGLIHA